MNSCKDCVFNFFRNGIRKCLANGEAKSKPINIARDECGGSWYSRLSDLDAAHRSDRPKDVNNNDYSLFIKENYFERE